MPALGECTVCFFEISVCNVHSPLSIPRACGCGRFINWYCNKQLSSCTSATTANHHNWQTPFALHHTFKSNNSTAVKCLFKADISTTNTLSYIRADDKLKTSLGMLMCPVLLFSIHSLIHTEIYLKDSKYHSYKAKIPALLTTSISNRCVLFALLNACLEQTSITHQLSILLPEQLSEL